MSENIRNATKNLHDLLENEPFNQRMFRGEQPDYERAAYLSVHLDIFTELDKYVPEDLQRVKYIQQDLDALGGYIDVPQSCNHYVGYLDNGILFPVTFDISAHIYLNYMGLLFGGQVMKKRYPKSSNIYTFVDVVASREYIRSTVVRDNIRFINEVRNGFEWHIDISRELGVLYGTR